MGGPKAAPKLAYAFLFAFLLTIVASALVASGANKKDYTFLPSIYCAFSSPYVVADNASQCQKACKDNGHPSASVKPSYLAEDLVYCCCE